MILSAGLDKGTRSQQLRIIPAAGSPQGFLLGYTHVDLKLVAHNHLSGINLCSQIWWYEGGIPIRRNGF